MPKPKAFFGIDFGTTCSATVSCIGGGRKMRRTRYYDGALDRPMLSAAAIDLNTGACAVGRQAWEQRLNLGNACRYIPSIKSVLGEDWQLKLDNGTVFTSQMLASELFSALKRKVTEHADLSLDRAVVAIPIGFDAEKRRQLRSAAQIAGVVIDSFVSEPTAAFFANYAELRDANTIAVFDWGGGTLDVSILEHEHGVVRERATAGLRLGGQDIDRGLAAHVHTKFCQKKGIHVAFDELDDKTADLLLSHCEDAKRELSSENESVVRLNRYGEYGSCRILLSYSWFRDIVRPYVQRAFGCLRQAIASADLTPAAIDRVLVTGGSSELRPLRELLESEFGDRLVSPAEKAWDVAEGAALLACLPGEHRSSQSVGLTLADGTYFELLKPGERLFGWHKNVAFGLVDDSKEARIVFAGSDDIEHDPNSRQVLPFPTYNFLYEKVLLDAEVDENNVFRVSVRSDLRPEEFTRIWEYPGLKTCYELPPTGGLYD